MAETVNIGEISNRLSIDIFAAFKWSAHPKREDNFPCTNPQHLVKSDGKKGPDGQEIKPKQKESHPGDVVFHYTDPYLKKKVYLHTDLKSYAKESVSTQKIRAAIESLAMTVDCARNSAHWRKKYSIDENEDIEVRGLLFVHNHDGLFTDDFDKTVRKTNFGSITIAPNVYIHFLGPHDINRLFTIANDIIRLQHQKTLPEAYSFYYPDLVMSRRQGDVFGQAATIEVLTAPYSIITYETGPKTPPGYLIYYNGYGGSADEFVYFLDSLSRFQMLEPGKLIRIRIVNTKAHEDLLSHFHAAVVRYAKAWGFDEARRLVLEEIKVEAVTAVASNYSPGFIGWRAQA